MKMGPRISKPVLAFVVAGAALTLLLVWVAWPRRDRLSGETTPPPAPESAASPAAIPGGAAPASSPAAAPAGGLPPVSPISLAGVLVDAENSVWNTDASWKRLPRGTQSLGGIEFHIEGVVQLQGEGSADAGQKYRTRVLVPLAQTNGVAAQPRVTERGAEVGSAHLLGASRYNGENGVKLADVVWRYADGSSRRSPLSYAVQLRDWRRMPYEEPAFLPDRNSKVVWRKPNPSEARRTYRLYRVSLANPEPAKTIRQLEFASAMSNPSLVLLGLTLDPLQPGERPDEAADLEETDPPLDGRVQLLVQNTDGQPIANAKIRAQCFLRDAQHKSSTFTKPYATDFRGEAGIEYVAREIERLELSARHEDYGGRKMTWDCKSGDVIPATYTLKLSAGLKLGGVVLDPQSTPVAGATVRLYRFWSGGEQIKQKGEDADFGVTVRTDAQGRWQARGAPKELLGHMGLEAKHPDFVGVNFTLERDSEPVRQMIAGTHELRLTQGLTVRGRVVDGADQPVEGASVFLARRFFRERQETKTGTDGRFAFKNVKEGHVPVTVMAKGLKPASQNVSVKADMEEVLFKLDRGSVLRALVQNAAGEPLAEVRVALEGHSVFDNPLLEALDFSTQTDAAGRFEWDGAPDEPVTFYFYKPGYEQKRGQVLKPNQDNLVTLRRTRKVEGVVLDATTEQPVTKFRVGVGRAPGRGQDFFADHPGMRGFSDPNGRFTFDLTEEASNGIRADADDYAEQTQMLPQPQDGVVQVVFRLKSSVALRGVVVSPQGLPQPDVNVAVVKLSSFGGGGGVTLQRARLKAWTAQAKMVTTDATGQFVIPSPPEEAELVVACGEGGFGQGTVAEVRARGGLVLQPFGRIEGILKIGGEPAPDQGLMLDLGDRGLSADWQSFKTDTDAQGRFSFDKVPPGACQVVRLIKLSANSWAHSHRTPVTVPPGQSTQVTLGDSGAVLKGQVRFETPPVEGEKLSLSGRLATPRPTLPAFHSNDEGLAFIESPEWKAQMKQHQNYAASVGADGSLLLDSIPPGTYTLTVTASKAGTRPFENPPVAQASVQVVVPDNASPQTPIALGEIVLKPVAKPAAPK